jgi:hypothetical protein
MMTRARLSLAGVGRLRRFRAKWGDPGRFLTAVYEELRDGN